MKKNTLPVIIRNVDRKLWTAFRMICIQEGKTATSKLKEMIKKTVRGNNENK